MEINGSRSACTSHISRVSNTKGIRPAYPRRCMVFSREGVMDVIGVKPVGRHVLQQICKLPNIAPDPVVKLAE